MWVNCMRDRSSEFPCLLGGYVTPMPPRRSPPELNWKHQWSNDEMQDALSESLFQNLPIEIMLRIFQYFSIPELSQVSLVCRHFKMIASHDQIWKKKCSGM